MSIAFDASSSTNGNNVASISWTHTCTGSNRILIVGVAGSNGASAVTYNSVSMTQAINVGYGAGGENSSLWYLVNPATGANTIVVTTVIHTNIAGGAASFTGVNQISPINATQSASGSGTSATLNITPTVDSSWVIDNLGLATNLTPTAGGVQVVRWSDTSTTDGTDGSTLGPISPASSTNLSWTLVSVSWGQVALSFSPFVVSNLTGAGFSGTSFRSVPRMVAY